MEQFEDLPEEIRMKIDEIIDSNLDLDSQLPLIDVLLYRDPVKFDAGNESGIGSDTDSGNGTIPPENESCSSQILHDYLQDSYGYCNRAPAFEERLTRSADASLPPPLPDIDEYINQMMLPPPPEEFANDSVRDAPMLSSVADIGTTSSGNNSLPIYPIPEPDYPDYDNDELPPAPTSTLAEQFYLPPPIDFEGSRDVFEQSSGTTDEVRHQNGKEKPARGPPVLPRSTNGILRTKIAEAEGLHVSHSESNLPKGRYNKRNSINQPVVEMRKKIAELPKQDRPLIEKEKAPWMFEQSRLESKIASKTPLDPTMTNDLKTNRKPEPTVSEQEPIVFSKYAKQPQYSSNTLDSRQPRHRSSLANPANRHTLYVDNFRLPFDDEIDESSDETDSDPETRQIFASTEDISGLLTLRRNKINQHQKQMVHQQRMQQNDSTTEGRMQKAKSLTSLYDPALDKNKTKLPAEMVKADNTSARKSNANKLDRIRAKFKKSKSNSRTALSLSIEKPANSKDAALLNNRESGLETSRNEYLITTPTPATPTCTKRTEVSRSFTDLLRKNRLELEQTAEKEKRRITFDSFRGEIKPVRWVEDDPRRGRNPLEMPGCTTRSKMLTAGCRRSIPISFCFSLDNKSQPLNSNVRSRNSTMSLSSATQSKIGLRSSVSIPLSPTIPADKVSFLRSGSTSSSPRNVLSSSTSSSSSAATSSFQTAAAPGDQNGILLRSGCQNMNTAVQNSPERVRSSYQCPPATGNQRPTSTSGATCKEFKPSAARPETPIGATTLRPVSSSESRLHDVSAPRPVSMLTGSSSSATVDRRNFEDEVMQKTYEMDTACNQAVDDIARLMSCLRTSTGAKYREAVSENSFESYRDGLVNCSRQLVTNARLLVSSAIKSRADLTQSVTDSLHTIATLTLRCRLVLHKMTSSSENPQAANLVDDILSVAQVFQNTLLAADRAVGKSQMDPDMTWLMKQTTNLAQVLSTLMKTVKSL